MSVYVVLLHSPMVNREGKEVTTAVTNLDIHDIARTCRTYGVEKYFIVNPEPEQEKLVNRILQHWKEEVSRVHHPSRANALDLVQFARTFEEVYNEVAQLGKSFVKPFVAMPDAKDLPGAWSYQKLRNFILEGSAENPNGPETPVIIVFGTGWGIAPSFYRHVDCALKPIRGPVAYNHLSVRSAAAIVLDRLLGA